MNETEVKFRVKSFTAVRAKIKKLGGRCEWKGEERNYFFDTPDKKLRKQKATLRLRERENGPAALTIKITPERDHGKYKVMREHEVLLDDAKAAREILQQLGLTQWFQYKKQREHWDLSGGVHIELDAVGKLKFVEIEASKKKIDALAKQLGLDWGASTTKGYLSILKAW
ncbi:MAG: class IV adenylate cyclase [Candidatus Harrisonbacteria bacterium]|nr:class IV adenylate cyclase [Candidatus Harrisonbacteria bacterium]